MFGPSQSRDQNTLFAIEWLERPSVSKRKSTHSACKRQSHSVCPNVFLSKVERFSFSIIQQGFCSKNSPKNFTGWSGEFLTSQDWARSSVPLFYRLVFKRREEHVDEFGERYAQECPPWNSCFAFRARKAVLQRLLELRTKSQEQAIKPLDYYPGKVIRSQLRRGKPG